MSKRLSDIMGLEIINVYNGDKYGYFGDCELLFEKNTGKLVKVIASQGKTSIFSFKDEDVLEIPWENRMKVCGKTIIFDYKI